MTGKSRWMALALVGALASGAAASAQRSPEAELARITAGRVAGNPVRCVDLPRVRQTHIVDKTAIVYDMGATIYVNRPRGGADSLRDDDILVTRLISSQLCQLDMVDLVDRSAGFISGFVSLGMFVPYTRPAKPPQG